MHCDCRVVILCPYGPNPCHFAKPPPVKVYFVSLSSTIVSVELLLFFNAFLVLCLRRVLPVLGHALILVLYKFIYVQLQAFYFGLALLTDSTTDLQREVYAQEANWVLYRLLLGFVSARGVLKLVRISPSWSTYFQCFSVGALDR